MIVGRGRTPVLWRLIGALALLACPALLSGCGAGAASASGDAGPPRHGGSIILGMDQEPPCLNVWHVCGGMAAAQNMTDPLWDGFFDVTPEGERFPLLATEVPTRENGHVTIDADGRMIVRMGIKPEAAWSDGRPITCDDLVFKWETLMNDDFLVGSRLGWDLIESIECPSPKETVTTFKEVYAPYLRVLESTPFPKHALEGKDFNTFMNDSVTVSNGPYVFGHWRRNVEYVIKRNPNYWNKGKNEYPYIDTLKYKFLKDTNTLKIQLRTGEVDWILAVPDTNLLAELKEFPRSDFDQRPGGYWEQFAFNTSKPQLKDPDTRKAIAYAIDRKQITEVVLRKQTKPLHSTLIPQAKDYFTPAWEEYSYDEAKVAEHMEKAGWKRSGAWWTKDGKPLKVLFKTTAGNALRMKVAQLLQQTFKRNGIQMEIALEAPAVFFGQSTVQGSFDIAIWAFSSSVDSDQTRLFHCKQIPTKANNFEGENNYRYCNEKVSALMDESDRVVEVADRAALMHQVQEGMADDMPVLPLYQRPETVAYSKRLKGVSNNPLGGVLWNVHEWWVTDA